ncbi:TRAP transporter small permease subunit [Loktanella agnita]|uniref:TRAP transporter small permease subunit n=1 Tax=Loktanella agnita TaxID=287097 RepID=UPI003987A4AF
MLAIYNDYVADDFEGVVLFGVVAVNAWSILAGWLMNRPFPGDFELTEMGIAIAVFAFLPNCQLAGANVSVDIFTIRAKPWQIALIAALVDCAFAALLIWRMWLGLVDYRLIPTSPAFLKSRSGGLYFGLFNAPPPLLWVS